MWPTRGLGVPFLWATQGIGRKVATGLSADDSTVTSDAAVLGRISGSRPRVGAITPGRIMLLRPLPDTTVTDDTSRIVVGAALSADEADLTTTAATIGARYTLGTRDNTSLTETASVRRNDDANVIRLLDPALFELLYPDLAYSET